MSSEAILLQLAAILILGIGAQWLSWRLRLPSILLLLSFGFLAGPIPRLLHADLVYLDPDALFGDLLFPLVSVSVALILFEGGLNLHHAELSNIRIPLRNLLTIGVLITWALSAAAAVWLLQLSWTTGLLLGAILVVTGPTVVGPLLQHIRPVGKAAAIARWEGIIIDPIGAILAVLVFDISQVLSGNTFWGIVSNVILSAGAIVLVGIVFGALGAGLVVIVFSRYWISDGLHNPFVLAVVVTVFIFANALEHEAGLLAVTVMGIILANQSKVTVHHIIEFKENITVLLIASLFILLASRIEPAQLGLLNWRMIVFVVVLMLIIRPAAVFLSTLGKRLKWQERVFLAWLAPRGIVAAAVASIFALKMQAHGTPLMEEEGKSLVAAVFVVIVVTVAVYGLTAAPLAKWLRLTIPNPQGVLLAGAHAGNRAIAHALKSAGIPVVLLDLNRENLHTARNEGLQCHYGSTLSNEVLDELDLGGIGRFLAMTRNDQVNSLAAWHMSELFSRKEIYRLAPKSRGAGPTDMAERHLHGRPLFAAGITHDTLDERFAAGAIVKKTKLTEEFDYAAFQKHHGDNALLLFVISSTGKMQVAIAGHTLKPQTGQTIIALVDAKKDDEESRTITEQ